MRTFLRGKITLLFMMLGMLIAVPTVAFAADLLTEAELSSDVNARTEVAPNDTENFNIKVWARGNLPNNTNVTGTADIINTYTMAANGSITPGTSKTTLQFTKGHNYGADGQTCPTTVATQPTGVTGKGCASDPFIVPATLVVGAVNAGTDGTLTVELTGSNALGLTAGNPSTPCSTSDSDIIAPNTTPDATDCSRDQGFVEVVDPNTAPSVPGVPSGTSPNQGTFTLDWDDSTDAQSNPITYTLEHKDSNDANFSPVASSISGSSYQFGDGPDANTDPDNPVEAEGTWTYRVSASDGTLSSDFSAASSPIKVDKSDPYDPTFSAGTPYYIAPSGDEWYKNSATVQFSKSTTTTNGDRDLLDTSAGSGVASISTTPTNTAGAITFSTSGTHTFSGRTVDVVGRQSALVNGSVKVDATDPVVNISDCPTTDVIKGSSQSISVSASDTHSGLKTDPSDATVELNTGTVGQKTVSFEAVDNVDRKNTASCTYNVIFDWSGFFRPVDNPDVVNSAKAGSTIPVKFSLGGDQGLNIFWTQTANVTYPNSGKLTFDQVTGDPVDALEEYSTSTVSGLKYDSTANQYIYNWKTDKNWAGTYRQLIIRLADGTYHRANFYFTK